MTTPQNEPTDAVAPRGKLAARGAGDPRVPKDLRPSGGWRVIAGKELADNLLSIRFFVLIVVLALAAVIAVSTAAGAIRDAASAANQTPAPFLLLFTQSPEQIPSFVALIGFIGPLVGIAFAFDAINNERAGRTLPRLVAQPVHRDDVINGSSRSRPTRPFPERCPCRRACWSSGRRWSP